MKIIYLICLLSFIGCTNKEISEKNNSGQSKYSFENIFSYNKEDTIFIKSRFTDCGEWGGHEEFIKVYRLERKIGLTYIKYKVTCGNIDSSGSPIQTKNITRNFILSDSQQLSLMTYFNNLMKFKFIDKELGNSGNSFLIEDSKGKLRLSQYGNNIQLLNNYNSLMKSLGLSKVIIENK
ncbi:hypothetical protein NZD88_07350 [Chryseobacterium antibioticum]|uniref:Lipoprotein n=1 Tax=Chryseobacterium pyrolae TaxID=2987481 RepID=A0ABT2IFF5_9FLAO|nr:hypothetical protein [Chryseobacterium pyrolae]MCT2407356.1 hypothetical protein [Chryseobacterium pyrolae]